MYIRQRSVLWPRCLHYAARWDRYFHNHYFIGTSIATVAEQEGEDEEEEGYEDDRDEEGWEIVAFLKDYLGGFTADEGVGGGAGGVGDLFGGGVEGSTHSGAIAVRLF